METLEARDTRMRRMIRRLRVDVLELAYANVGATYSAARAACLDCAHAARCQAWLLANADGPPSFCPNLDRFAQFAMH